LQFEQRGKTVNFGPRKFQRENLAIAKEVLARQERRPFTIINHVTTGAGKSWIPPIYGAMCIPGFADKLCWVVPRISLGRAAAEAFDERDLREWLEEMRRIRMSCNDLDPSRGTHGYVTTYQAISENPELHRAEFKRFRYILVLDEPHHIEDGGPWHRAIQPLYDSAVLVVLMTGTLERGNGKRIAFLDYCPITHKGRIGETVDLSDDARRRVVIYTRADALAEKAILPITFKHLDMAGEWIDRFGRRQQIHSFNEVTADDSGDALFTGLSTDYALRLLDDCVQDWQAHARFQTRSCLLVVAHRQHAAKVYYKRLKELGLRVAVAVSDDGDEAQEAIFKYRRGHYVVLVTVGMAYEGLNVPSITHLACLTHIRSRPWIEQVFGRLVRVDRQAGPWQQQWGYAYVPDDPLMRAVIEDIKVEQAPFIQDRDGPPPPPPPEPPAGLLPLNGDISGCRVSELDGREMSQEETALHQHAIDQAGLKGRINPLDFKRAMEVWAELKGGGEVPARHVHTLTVKEEEDKLRKRIQHRCSVIDYHYHREPGSTNGEMMKQFGKSRELMTNAELQAVWGFINQRYGEVGA
jgi:superfamily II DNA or RNA helicase